MGPGAPPGLGCACTTSSRACRGHHTFVLLLRHIPGTSETTEGAAAGGTWDHPRGDAAWEPQAVPGCPVLEPPEGFGHPSAQPYRETGMGVATGAHRPWDPTGHTGLDMTGGWGRALALGRFFPAPWKFPDPIQPSQALLSTPSILLHLHCPRQYTLLAWGFHEPQLGLPG